ncbi:septation protein SpoVG family protein [Candidatus Saccharibacteria bacterium]|nr:septation protein SpoVG family protein [Candidatus Saccharibacteria bacterium]
MEVTEVNIVPVKAIDGLVAFASCVVNGQLYLGSLGVRRRLDGSGYRITYPTKRIGSQELNYFHPLNRQTGNAIEQAIAAKCNELFERSDEDYGRHRKTTADNQ